MSDVVIVGGGVIGLTAAWELAQQGAQVTVVDQSEIGTEASWAGAGMIPPADPQASPAANQLAMRSLQLWPEVSTRLHELTGIDNGYRQCQALRIFPMTQESLPEHLSAWQNCSVRVQPVSNGELQQLEPTLSPVITQALLLPDFAQVRNPRHLKALRAACDLCDVVFRPQTRVTGWRAIDNTIRSAITSQGEIFGDKFLVAAGAWSGDLLQQAGITLEIVPVLGQMLLLRGAEPLLTRVIEAGPQYIVPRDDGRVLVGSTEELVGFEKRTTPPGIDGLRKFAYETVPALRSLEEERTWSGLRPHAASGSPHIGLAGDWDNLWVATGHFRAGLSSSPATGELLRQLLS